MEREAECKRLRSLLELSKEKVAVEEKKVEELTSRVSSVDVLYTKAQSELVRTQEALSKQTVQLEKMKIEHSEMGEKFESNTKRMSEMDKEMQKIETRKSIR